MQYVYVNLNLSNVRLATCLVITLQKEVFATHLSSTIQQSNRFVIHLQQHFLGPDLLFGAQLFELPDGIFHCYNGLAFIHDEGSQVLERGGNSPKGQTGMINNLTPKFDSWSTCVFIKIANSGFY